MARYKLTPEDRLRGVNKALKNPKTPKQLREGLRRYKERLEKQLGK